MNKDGDGLAVDWQELWAGYQPLIDGWNGLNIDCRACFNKTSSLGKEGESEVSTCNGWCIVVVITTLVTELPAGILLNVLNGLQHSICRVGGFHFHHKLESLFAFLVILFLSICVPRYAVCLLVSGLICTIRWFECVFLFFECARFSALGARVMVRGIGAREKHGVGWNYSSCFICTGSILFLLRIDPVRVWKFSFLDVTCLGLVESWRMVLLSCRVLAMCRQSCLALVWLAGENIFASFFEGGPSFCFIHYASSDLAIHSLYVIK